MAEGACPVVDDVRLLTGDTRADGEGAVGPVEIVVDPEVNVGNEYADGKAGRSAAYRVAPILRVLPGADHILVGQIRIWVGESTRLRLVIQAVWRRDEKGWLEVAPLSASAMEPKLTACRADLLAHPAHGVPRSDPRSAATAIAKGLAEGSRNAVAQLRAIRYDLEQQLSIAIRDPGKSNEEAVLASLIELGRATNRARDQAREAEREALWVWVSDGAAYRRYRRAADPTLLTGRIKAAWMRPDWLPTLDDAVRHCRATERQLGEEATLLYGLLDAASTLSVAREARAQENFNTVAAMVAAGLGLPALVLSLYGADAYLPFEAVDDAALLVPVALALALAVAAGALVDRRRRSTSLVRAGLALVFVVLIVLTLAAVLAPNIEPR